MNIIISEPRLDARNIQLALYDLDNTLCDTEALRDEGEGETKKPRLMPGAREFLMKGPFRKFLVTAGKRNVQTAKLEKLRIEYLFREIVICQDPEDKYEIFAQILDAFDVVDRKQVLVVGDRIDAEILYGNQLGCTTVRMVYGKYADMIPDEANPCSIPTYSVTELGGIFR